jgi:hypothetical protein
MMTKSKETKPGAAHPIRDEPGADQRFKGILKRALNTPPPRKQGDQRGRQKPTGKKP